MARFSISIGNAVTLLATTVVLSYAGTPEIRITAVRYWSLGEVTRVAIEMNGEFRYRSERLHNPDRIFFDLAGVKPLTPKRIDITSVNDKLLKRIRVAETQRGVTRVVLDQERTVDFSVSQLANPERLIIELRPEANQNPLTTPPLVEPSVISSNRQAVTPPVKLMMPPAKTVEMALVTPEPPKINQTPALVRAKPPAGTIPLPAHPDPVPRIEQPALLAKLKPPGGTMVLPPRPEAPRIEETPKAAKRASDGSNSLIRALGLKLNRVVLDAGHGGQDQGTVGPHGLKEKDLVLDVAKRLGKLIEERMGSEVIYTRADDTFVPLEMRTQIANQRKADLFLSLHANSSPYPKAGGVETYYLNFTNAQDALDVAARENASSQKSIYELHDIIQKITLHDKAEESKEFASRIQNSLYTFSARSNPTGKNRGVKKAPFVVLIGATMPSVLAEIGFVSNIKEEALLKRPDHRQRLAEALYHGVSKYAENLSHFQIASRSE